jgi:hypothetical protein
MERHLNSTRTHIVIWLRRTHGWIGLWGATLGLLFGFSGIWLNHRAVLPLQPALERHNQQLPLPDPAPADAAALAVWLQSSLSLPRAASVVRVEPAKPAPWAERGAGAATAMQPEHWTISFNAPAALVQAEYWVGNRTVGVRRTDNGLVATLANLHKGVGMPMAWILLVDTLAGSLILLSLSGLSLWMLTRRRRALGLAILGLAFASAAGLALARL